VNLGRRRLINGTLLVLASGVFAVWCAARWATLGRAEVVSGWALLALVVFLLLYNLRKKLPFLPLLRSAVWLQAHAYLGLLAFVLYGLHAGPDLPRGPLEAGLAALFLLAVVSGFVGLWLSRSIPPRLRTRGEEVIFERIPALVGKLRGEAEALVLRSVEEHGTTAISDYYGRRLHRFFARPRHPWRHLFESRAPRQALAAEMEHLRRFLSEEERELFGELEASVLQKDDLDYHFALQSVLKYWLFLHVPLSYGLIVLALLHALTANAFGASL